MRILILGGAGMLGHQLFLSLRERHEVRVTLHHGIRDIASAGLFSDHNAYPDIDVRSDALLSLVFEDFRPEAVINAVGIIKQRNASKAAIPSIEINALLPHRLSLLCEKIGTRLVQPSTDCVFSGKLGNYKESDFADACDLYGRTKYLGEVGEAHCITLRTSIIGLELTHKQSLIEWFLAQQGKIKGYRKAIYSGLTTLEFARVIEKVLTEHGQLSGVYQVSSDAIDKYALLTRLAAKLNRTDISIEPDDSFVCDRSLDGSRFSAATGYRAPGWDTLLDELARQIISREKRL
ncbi:MAG: SDR family oxidoreductase [Methylococcaceae bacterium]|nr:SDR family oxidoreductase [Methylococcaceae bacterium]